MKVARAGLVLFATAFLFFYGEAVASAKVQMPSDAGERDMALQLIKDICRDFDLIVVEDPVGSGNWFLKVGPRGRITEVPRTPLGCNLILALINHPKGRTVRIVGDATIRMGGSEVGDNPNDGNKDKATGALGAGTDATVRFNFQRPEATNLLVYDAAGKKIKAPRSTILAHELIHALHDMNGSSNGDDPETQTIETPGANEHGITENDIRDEQSRVDNYVPPLVHRHGHCGERVR